MRIALIASLAAALVLAPAAVANGGKGGGKHDDARFATFNASLNRSAAGQLIARSVDTEGTSRRRTLPRRFSAFGRTSS